MHESSPLPSLSPAEQWLDKYGDALYRYAFYRVRDASLAEDLVQETLLAAFKARGQFAGRSTEATWLTGILKNKIVDQLRKSLREQPSHGGEELDGLEEAYFDSAGHWKAAPNAWREPDDALEQSEFWQIFQRCVDGIPAKQAEIFKLCEIDGLPAKDIGKVLDVSPTNVWVALHRARLKLRECMEKLWFNNEGVR